MTATMSAPGPDRFPVGTKVRVVGIQGGRFFVRRHYPEKGEVLLWGGKPMRFAFRTVTPDRLRRVK